MIYLQRALSSEMLKLRRTLTLWVTLLAPTTVSALYFLILLSQSGQNAFRSDSEAWWGLTKSVCAIWSVAMLPLFITLETALLGNIEHSQHHWKHLYALSIPRSSIYTAKWLVSIFLVTLSSLVLWVEMLATGLFMRWTHPLMGFGNPIPLWTITRTVGGILLAALLILSIHNWIALRFQSFAFASGVGIAATISNLMVLNSDKWGQIYPWSLGLHSYANTAANLPRLYTLAIGGGLLVAILGAIELSHRDVLE